MWCKYGCTTSPTRCELLYSYRALEHCHMQYHYVWTLLKMRCQLPRRWQVVPLWDTNNMNIKAPYFKWGVSFPYMNDEYGCLTSQQYVSYIILAQQIHDTRFIRQLMHSSQSIFRCNWVFPSKCLVSPTNTDIDIDSICNWNTDILFAWWTSDLADKKINTLHLTWDVSCYMSAFALRYKQYQYKCSTTRMRY